MTIDRDTNQLVPLGRLALEILFFVALAFAIKQLFLIFFWRFAGPLSLYVLLILLTIYLRSQGLRWRDFGLAPLKTWRSRVLILPQTLLALAAFAGAVAPILLLGEHYEIEFITTVPEGVDERFGDVEANPAMFLLWLAIVWTAAAFGEEMFFRGYLVTRLSALFRPTPVGPILAIIIAALIFGVGHIYYQGLRGFVITGAIGIAFGGVFLLLKRNLWPLILLHGLMDTAVFTITFLGIDPS